LTALDATDLIAADNSAVELFFSSNVEAFVAGLGELSNSAAKTWFAGAS